MYWYISSGSSSPLSTAWFLCSCCASLVHLLIVWLIASFLLSQSQHLLFYVSSILVLICLVFLESFYTAINRCSISFFRLPIHRHSSGAFPIVWCLKYPKAWSVLHLGFLYFMTCFSFLLWFILAFIINLSLLLFIYCKSFEQQHPHNPQW